ncbi:MAG: hypothetical protein RMK29_17935 [Myxococcales bacterium]|nr:hypothetical protein [Myxococcota bacterium]MDW8283591.1 hypothetical protein [Myxococcales bacterium]
MSRGRTLAAVLAAILSACAVPVDLDAVPVAKASCEEPTRDLLLPDARMLPGRICQQCHTRGGQGYRFKWTASGTVFVDPRVPCNTGGLEGVTVEIFDTNGQLQVALVTNEVGNFFTDIPIAFPIRARIRRDGIVREMRTPALQGSCASCHQKEPKNGAPGPIALHP